MTFRSLLYLVALGLSPQVSADVFVSSSGQEFYETHTIFEPANNQEVKDLLQKVYDGLKEEDPSLAPIAVGAGGFYLKDHWQGLSFGAHAHGNKNQPLLRTVKLKKKTLTPEDYVFDKEKRTILLKVKGGNTQEETLALANSILDKETRKHNEFFLIGPSSGRVTIAGAIAAHAHYRSTYPYGGYFFDQVENFTLIAMQDGKPTEIFCSREVNAELFHSIPGSFGRGGIISDVTIRLELMPKDYKPTLSITKISGLENYLQAFSQSLDSIKQPNLLNDFNRRILGVNTVMTDKFYYIWNFNFEPASKVKDAPVFEFFDKPGFRTLLAHTTGHAIPFLANSGLDKIIFRKDHQFYQNDLMSWLFFHDGYLNFLEAFPWMKAPLLVPKYMFTFIFGEHPGERLFGKDTMETAHQVYMMKREHFAEFMRFYTELLKIPKFQMMGFKCRDFVPLPATKTLMSPAHSENLNDVFMAVTLSWPVHSEADKKLINELKERIIALDYVKLHPLKEFDVNSDVLQKLYAGQSQQLESILLRNRIDDSMIWTKLKKALYGIPNPLQASNEKYSLDF